jgi:hypothetical protein
MLETILGIAVWAAIAAAGFFYNRYKHYQYELKAQELICDDMRGKLASSINFLVNTAKLLPLEEREQCFLFLLGTVQLDKTLQAKIVEMLKG